MSRQQKLLKQITSSPFEQIAFAVRTHYKLLPTSSDWLDMTREQVLKEYLLITESRQQNLADDEQEAEQIMYEDEEFDEWDKETESTGTV